MQSLPDTLATVQAVVTNAQYRLITDTGATTNQAFYKVRLN
jgi:hypothetical protein